VAESKPKGSVQKLRTCDATTLKMEAADFSEMLVPVCQTTFHHIQQNNKRHIDIVFKKKYEGEKILSYDLVLSNYSHFAVSSFVVNELPCFLNILCVCVCVCVCVSE
jgi:hypothetical protein